MDFLRSMVRDMFQDVLAQYARVLPSFPALLGDGRGNVAVGTQPGFVWIRLGLEGEDGLGMAWNQTVQERDGLPIKVGYRLEQPQLFQVLCQREVWAGTGEARIAQVGPHAETHIWAHPDGGNDPVFVWWRAIADFRCSVVSGYTVKVGPGVWRGWAYKSTQQIDLAGYRPEGFAARYVLIALDFDGNALARPGALVSPPSDLALSDCPGPELTEKPVAAVALYGPQEGIRDSDDQYDIVDLRWPDFGSLDAIVHLRDMIAHLECDIDLELTKLVLRVGAQRDIAIRRGLDQDLVMSMHRVLGA